MTAKYCNRLCQETHWPSHKRDCKLKTVPQAWTGGRVGLNNLGNTCFMNAALQSLSKATPLTRLFLSGRFKADLNPNNPLGTGGKLAHAYNNVLRDLWWNSNGKRSTSPTALKRAIALFAPRFAGCIQHDTQEFLAYLLDGLHEDLNRIRKAPYVEMPDVTDGQNMAVAGARAWEAHCRRNDSLVLDTFYGQFKSTCVCPQCKRVSVSFDAFNHVSLEIPQAKNAIMPVCVLVFTAKKSKPAWYGVEIRRNSPIVDLKDALGQLAGIDPERLVVCEIFENAIVDILKPKSPVSDIRQGDFIAAYEVDDYTDTTFHVLATHRRFAKDIVQVVEDEVDSDSPGRREAFGLPFMTSFSADLSCREIADAIWSRLEHIVAKEDGSGIYSREQLQIRFQDGRGKNVYAFPVEGEESETTKSSILPQCSDTKLVDYLGQSATNQFLFVSLDWSEEGQSVSCLEDEARFCSYDTDRSWSEVSAKAKAKAALPKASVTLDQCFEAFTKPERLDENNKWYCSRCKEHVQALKTMQLWRLPNVLIVHLKRFEFKHILRRDKLDTFVDFPLESLDMSRHCASSSATLDSSEGVINDHVPADYDLFAVTNHFGRMGAGHYTAFARSWDESSGLSPNWDLFDDSNVRCVENAGAVVSSHAYVLFYKRRAFR